MTQSQGPLVKEGSRHKQLIDRACHLGTDAFHQLLGNSLNEIVEQQGFAYHPRSCNPRKLLLKISKALCQPSVIELLNKSPHPYPPGADRRVANIGPTNELGEDFSPLVEPRSRKVARSHEERCLRRSHR